MNRMSMIMMMTLSTGNSESSKSKKNKEIYAKIDKLIAKQKKESSNHNHDYIKCTNCGWKGTVERGEFQIDDSEECPHCHKYGTLVWDTAKKESYQREEIITILTPEDIVAKLNEGLGITLEKGEVTDEDKKTYKLKDDEIDFDLLSKYTKTFILSIQKQKYIGGMGRERRLVDML